MKVLLITPPMTELSFPYPATAYLTGFLKSRNVGVEQFDASLELALSIFSHQGLQRLGTKLKQKYAKKRMPNYLKDFWSDFDRYLSAVEPVISFLQGRDPGLATLILRPGFLPEPLDRFSTLAGEISLASGILSSVLGEKESQRLLAKKSLTEEQAGLLTFGKLGALDHARYRASLFIHSIVRVIQNEIDSDFSMSRYAESLAGGMRLFAPLQKKLDGPASFVDEILEELTVGILAKTKPTLVGISVPFPGNVYGAFKMAQAIKKTDAKIKTVMGGGFVSTELRNLTAPKVFDYFDYVTLDAGERPLLNIIEGKPLVRTFVRQSGKVTLTSDLSQADFPFKEIPRPSYIGLDFNRYLALLDMLNPFYTFSTLGRWNKMTLAHGCYWRKCSFCDVHLDYVGRFEPAAADELVNRIEELIAETGSRGFHFVDEAMPPNLLRAMAERLLERKIVINWWGNVRFDKAFTPDSTKLLAKSGCVAVTGGLEVGDDRLLGLMNKGVTVEQVTHVTRAFADAGIFTHAYLIYGFPTQTVQELIDSLEVVRQLFEAGCLQSAFWHKFGMTPYSPIARDPKRFNVSIAKPSKHDFSDYSMKYKCDIRVPYDKYSQGLNNALSKFMVGIGLHKDVREWFPNQEVPRTSIPKNRIKKYLVTGSKV